MNAILGHLRTRLTQNSVRIGFFTVGILILALGINLMSIVPKFGLSPWDSFFIALRTNFGWTLGWWMFLCNLVFFLSTLTLNRKFVSLGTVFTMLIISGFVDAIHFSILRYFLYCPSIVNFVLGACCIGYGIGIYVSTSLCFAPQEGFMLALAEKTRWSFGMIQNLASILVLIISFFLKGPIFWGTLVLAFTTGFIIQLAMKQSKALLTLLTKETANL